MVVWGAASICTLGTHSGLVYHWHLVFRMYLRVQNRLEQGRPGLSRSWTHFLGTHAIRVKRVLGDYHEVKVALARPQQNGAWPL